MTYLLPISLYWGSYRFFCWCSNYFWNFPCVYPCVRSTNEISLPELDVFSSNSSSLWVKSSGHGEGNERLKETKMNSQTKTDIWSEFSFCISLCSPPPHIWAMPDLNLCNLCEELEGRGGIFMVFAIHLLPLESQSQVIYDWFTMILRWFMVIFKWFMTDLQVICKQFMNDS